MKAPRHIGPNILDGITLLMAAMFILFVIVTPKLYVNWLEVSLPSVLWEFLLPVILAISFLVFGIIISWQHLRDQVVGDSKFIQLYFGFDQSDIYGWWKKYQSIKFEGNTFYIPNELFMTMQKNRTYILEYLPRSKIVINAKQIDAIPS